MTADEQRRAFDRRHAIEGVRITVLTGDWTGGASQVRPDPLWTRSVDLLAWVDEHGTLVVDDGRLEWLVTEDERRGGPFDLDPHQQYDVRVHRAAPDPAEYARHGRPVPDLSGSFALDEVLGPARVSDLDDRLRRWLEPTVVSSDLGTVTLQRTYRYFSGTVAWGEGQVSVLLDVDDDAPEGAETCAAALARLEEHVGRAGEVVTRWRAFAASELLELARHWQVDRDDAGTTSPLTAASVAGRLTLRSVSVSTDGGTIASYDDGDLFLGHVVQVQVAPDGTLLDAEMAG